MADHSFSPGDPERAERGNAVAQDLLGVAAIPATSPFTAAGRDFVFSEIWTRPDLDRRSRLWITLSCVCAAGSPTAMQTYLRAALRSHEVTLVELREFALHFSVFQGFPKGAEVDALLNGMEIEGQD